MQKIFVFFQQQAYKLINTNPLGRDCFILSVFAGLITFNPYFLWGKINTFELGIYLPSINAILSGDIPFRDFFYLRGPFELYVPALFMYLFGAKISILSLYFYIGTIACLIICIYIAKELYKTRMTLYLMTFVLVARTFPRVVFTFWGGMRFALGLLSLLFLIYFLKSHKKIWLFFSGVICAFALLTSIDVGLCALFCFFLTFLFNKIFIQKNTLLEGKILLIYIAGSLSVLIPFFFYLYCNQAFSAFINCTFSVITNMYNTFPDHLVEYQPKNLVDGLKALLPSDSHFKHLTPAYCYLFFFGFIFLKFKKRILSKNALPVIAVAFYGLASFLFAFRKIGASNFEMALQPEKILLFIMLEEIFLWLLSKKASLLSTLKGSIVDKIKIKAKGKIWGITLLLFLFIGSSLGYSIQRYNHRFFAFKYLMAKIFKGNTAKLKPLYQEDSVLLTIDRVQNFRVPLRQANNIQKLSAFIEKNTAPEDIIFMSPELGTFSFIVNRPFLGRFPMVSFSWINDQWHQELMQDLRAKKPRYAVLSKDQSIENLKVFFQIKRNKDKYDEVYNYIQQHYSLVSSTPDLNIYKVNP